MGEIEKMPVFSRDDTNTRGARQESLEALFASLESPLLAYAMKLVRRNGNAQDIVQEAFVRLHENFESVNQPKAWLYRIVHNLAANHHEAVTQARESLKSLDERSRKLIQLKFDEGLSYKQISERMDLSISNVGYILHNALKSLAIELKKTGVGL